MRKITHTFLLTLLMSMVGVKGFGYTCKVNGICYNLNWNNLTATVTYSGYPYNSEYTGQYHDNETLRNVDVQIPSTITYENVEYTVTAIGDNAFYDCGSHVLMSSVTIPPTVTSIGEKAFWKCTNLTSITIGNGVTSIGSYAFYYCSGLTSITIPNSVTSIGDDAFSGCSGLTSISVGSVNTIYDSRNNCNAIIETASNTLITGCKNTIIPNSVTSIGSNAFYGCRDLTSIIIPNSVTSIVNWAFYGCFSLTNVTVERETPVSINPSAFSNRADATLYVPCGCKAAYEAADYWKEFKEIVETVPHSVSITMATSSNSPRTMKGYSSPYGLDFTEVDGVKAYTAVGFSEDHVVYLSRVKVVPPNTGVVLKTENPGITVDVPTTDKNAYLANLLLPAVSNVTVNPTEVIAGTEYRNLMVGQLNGTTKMGFVEFSSAVTRSNNCYLHIPSSFYNSATSARLMGGFEVVFDEGESTNIREIEEKKAIGNDNVYDLQGRKVTTPSKGLVIKNGKLVLIK